MIRKLQYVGHQDVWGNNLGMNAPTVVNYLDFSFKFPVLSMAA